MPGERFNSGCFLQDADPGVIIGEGPRATPFRVATNAGDVLGTVNKGPLASLLPANQLYGLNGKRQQLRRDGIRPGPAAYSGNPKYVYDSSNYTKFKALVAKQKTYNDLSFGGSGREILPLMSRRARAQAQAQALAQAQADLGNCATEKQILDAESRMEAEFENAENAIRALSPCNTPGDCATEKQVAEAKSRMETEFEKADNAIRALSPCSS